MDAETIQKITELVQPQTIEYRGASYGREEDNFKALEPYLPPLAEHVTVKSLGGLLDLVYIESESGKTASSLYAMVVVGPRHVKLVQKADAYGRLPIRADAARDENRELHFGTFLNPEDFILMVQTQFQQADDAQYVLDVCSRLTSSSVAVAEDNGLAQTTVLTKGVVVRESVELKPRVKLRPFRSFFDLDIQPQSEFLFRLKQRDNLPPQVALFLADGERWKEEATKSISDFLVTDLKDKNIGIPVVS